MNAREQIAEALRSFDVATGAGIPDEDLADALMPLVDRLRAEAAAEALVAAADWLWDDNGEAAAAYHHLRDRAAALRAAGVTQ